jgi:hypothetical protein
MGRGRCDGGVVFQLRNELLTFVRGPLRQFEASRGVEQRKELVQLEKAAECSK